MPQPSRPHHNPSSKKQLRSELGNDASTISQDGKPTVGQVEGPMIQRARNGNRAAIAQLLHAYQDMWYRFCFAQLRCDDLARDATQETALRVLKHLPRFRGESKLRTWTFGIALNVCRELRRKHTLRLTDHASLDDRYDEKQTPPHQEAEQAEQHQHLRAVLAQLSDRQREAVTLRYFEDLDTRQTAQIMGCAVGTVKATLHQALHALRQQLTGGCAS